MKKNVPDVTASEEFEDSLTSRAGSPLSPSPEIYLDACKLTKFMRTTNPKGVHRIQLSKELRMLTGRSCARVLIDGGIQFAKGFGTNGSMLTRLDHHGTLEHCSRENFLTDLERERYEIKHKGYAPYKHQVKLFAQSINLVCAESFSQTGDLELIPTKFSEAEFFIEYPYFDVLNEGFEQSFVKLLRTLFGEAAVERDRRKATKENGDYRHWRVTHSFLALNEKMYVKAYPKNGRVRIEIRFGDIKISNLHGPLSFPEHLNTFETAIENKLLSLGYEAARLLEEIHQTLQTSAPCFDVTLLKRAMVEVFKRRGVDSNKAYDEFFKGMNKGGYTPSYLPDYLRLSDSVLDALSNGPFALIERIGAAKGTKGLRVSYRMVSDWPSLANALIDFVQRKTV